MKHLGLLLLVMQVAGCSLIFGDTFRDKSEDYLQSQQLPVVQLPAGVQAVSFEDQLVIPEIGANTVPEAFEVPKPPKILVGKAEQRITHYSELNKPKYTAQLLEPDDALPSIFLAAPLQVGWSLVKESLDKAPYKVLDFNRSGGVFYLDIRDEVEPEEDCFIFNWFCSAKPLPESLQLKVLPSDGGTSVALVEDDKLADSVQLQIITKVFQLLPL